MLTSLLLALSSSYAAEVTEVPPWLRGDVDIGYALDYTTGSLVEGDADVGQFTQQDHIVHFGGAFAAAPGVALYFDVPVYALSRLSFTDAFSMAYDPLNGIGSMAYGEPLTNTPLREGSGPGGVWLGVRGTPFSETLWPRRGNRSTWMLDVGYRTPDASNFYVADDASRGGGPGASAFRLRSAFSTTKGVSQPYMRVTWLKQGVIATDLVDEDGNLLTAGAEVWPGQSIDVLAGVQARAFENTVNGASFDFDFHLGAAYNSWSTVPSGIYLPSVLSASREDLVTSSEYGSAYAGLGFYWRMFKYLQLDLGADVAYLMPHRLEHPYAVSTGMDTLSVRANGQISVLIR